MKITNFCPTCGEHLRPTLNINQEVEVICNCHKPSWTARLYAAIINFTYFEIQEYKDFLYGYNPSNRRFHIIYYPVTISEPLKRMVDGYTAVEVESLINMVDICEDFEQVLLDAKLKREEQERVGELDIFSRYPSELKPADGVSKNES